MYVLISIVKLIMDKHTLNLKHSKWFLIFWFISLLIMLTGWFTGLLLGYSVDAGPRDALAFLFIFILFFLFLSMPNLKERFNLLVICFLRVTMFYMLILFAATFFTDNLFGFSLYYADRLSGLSQNPNQFALLVLPLPFMLIYLVKVNKHLSRNEILLIILCFFIVIRLGHLSRSDGLIVAWYFSLVITLVYFFVKYIVLNPSLKRYVAILFLFSISTLGFVFYINEIELIINESIDKILHEGNQSQVRFTLWRNGIEAINLSPLFGLGPGAFAGLTGPLGGAEAHNTFIDWGTSTGYIGLILIILALSIVLIKLLKSKQILLFNMLIAITIFSITHYVFRHPVFWFFILFIVISSVIKRGDNSAMSSGISNHSSI